MIYVTGDTYGDFNRIEEFCKRFETQPDDIMIILGDSGINYYGGSKSRRLKTYLSALPIAFFCIHGNHENRPQNIPTYKEQDWHGGIVFAEEEYPNLFFAKDGEVYNFDGRKCIAIGGAYSVDKYWRLSRGAAWWEDEQPSDEIKLQIENKLATLNYKIDVVLSHTCPYKYVPREVFLSCVDQSTVDNSTELWLDILEDKLDYKKWYCGHYHTNKSIDKVRFLFEEIENF